MTVTTTSYQSALLLGTNGAQTGYYAFPSYNTYCTIAEFTADQNCTITNISIVIRSDGNGNGFDLQLTGTDGSTTQIATNSIVPPNYAGLNVESFSVSIPVTTGVTYSVNAARNGTTYVGTQSGPGYAGNGSGFNGNSNGINWLGIAYNSYPFEVAVSWTIPNQPPNAPSFSNISSSGSTINTKPKFYANVSDSDSGNTITNIEVQTSTSSAFSSNVVDDQYGSDSGYGTSNPSLFTGMPTPNNSTNLVTYHWSAALATGIYYIRARCKDNNAAWGGWSATQQFTIAAIPWTDTPVAGDPGMKAQWVDDLASVINNARQFRGLATFAFTDGTIAAQNSSGSGTDIKATHITERRQKLLDVLSLVGITWSPAAVSNASDRDGQHIIDLRSYSTQT